MPDAEQLETTASSLSQDADINMQAVSQKRAPCQDVQTLCLAVWVRGASIPAATWWRGCLLPLPLALQRKDKVFKHRSENLFLLPHSSLHLLVETRKNTNTHSYFLKFIKISSFIYFFCFVFLVAFFKTICNIYVTTTLSSGAWTSCGCCCWRRTATRGTWRKTWAVTCARPSGRWRSRSCRMTSRLFERSCSCLWGRTRVSDDLRPHAPITWSSGSCSHHLASPSQGRERSSPDHRRYSMLDPSALDSEVNRLRHRLLNTEDALRNALEHNQQVDQLVLAMRQRPDKSPVTCGHLQAHPKPADTSYCVLLTLQCHEPTNETHNAVGKDFQTPRAFMM